VATPRQFGVLLTLHQQGTLTLTDLARHIRVDQSTLGEMIYRMAVRSLIIKRDNGEDRRSAEVLLAPAGRKVLLRIVAGAAQTIAVGPRNPNSGLPVLIATYDDVPYRPTCSLIHRPVGSSMPAGLEPHMHKLDGSKPNCRG
jgi:hypothetical protein